MRVMQVMAGGEHGGAETFFVDLVTALQDRGLDQRAVIRRNPARSENLRKAGIPLAELRFGGPLDIITKPAMRREIARFQPDIVQTWMVRATKACLGGRFVHVGWLGGYYKPPHFRACDHVVGVTQDIADHMRAAGWAEPRTHYLPTFAVRHPAAPLSRADYDTPDDVPIHVMVPAFVISELRIAFQIGFMIFLPFLIVDLIVASVLMRSSSGLALLSATIGAR